MSQHPIDLSITDDNLLRIVGFNHLEITYFKTDGEFVRKKKSGGTALTFELDGWQLKRRKGIAAIEHGTLFASLGMDCGLVALEEKTWLALHNARAILTSTEDGSLVVARRSGTIELYEDGCNLIKETPVNVERFRIDPIQSPFITKMNKRIGGKDAKGYIFGLPIINVAARDKNTIWLLIRDERTAFANEKPDWKKQKLANKITWLGEIDPFTQKFRFLTKLDKSYANVQYSSGHLILTSEADTTVRVYQVSATH